ncbi:MAG TPA: NADH-quinone oxidoreductase subunit M [Williamwhitmania sp.]|nr:NADH-quinone oxidoreductase subunit M [Williamwhitmania sp.]
MNWLSVLVGIPLITAIAILFAKKENTIRILALGGSLLQLLFAIFITIWYMQLRGAGAVEPTLFNGSASWFPALHINYQTGVDGISLALILLTALVVVGGILVSWHIEKQVKEFFFLILLLSVGAYGFFIARDLFMMFFFLELAIIPKFLLIGIWGSGRKEYSAMKLVLMLMGGSALVFVGILLLYFSSGTVTGTPTWSIDMLATIHIPLPMQRAIYLLTFTGFGVFTAMFPFHTWAPDGHSSAPTAASMFLAGISMKLGGYGIIRVATFLAPDAAAELSWVFIIPASIAILYGAFATMMQKDLKYMNAYSSVSHTGFVVLGIAMLTKTAIVGAVMQMVSHGIMTALFFAAIGMIYNRTHTRMVNELGGMLKQLPFISTAFIVAGLCSLGLPGFSGFVAEMTVFVGSWERTGVFYKIATILAAISIVVTAVYILRAIGLAIWGTVTKKEYLELKDATWNERLAAILLISGIVFIGTMPWWINQLVGADALHVIARITSSTIN